MDARVLISLNPSKEILSDLCNDIPENSYAYPIEILGGLNTCFLYRKEGCLRKDFPIIKKNRVNVKTNSPPNPTFETNPSS